MPTITFDLQAGPNSVHKWPVGAYAARITAAEVAIAVSSGQPKLNIVWELYHPDYGTGTLKDSVPVRNQWKSGNFYAAWMGQDNLNEILGDQAEGKGEVDPDNLVGAEFIVHLGVRIAQDGPYAGQEFREVVPPFYSPISRTDLLGY